MAVDEAWLDRAKELHNSGHWEGATGAALIALVEWLYEPLVRDEGGEQDGEPQKRRADQLERLVWRPDY